MTLLLDTQILLWAASDSDRLPQEARNLLDDPTTNLMFSTASIWEVVIKSGLGRKDFRVDPRRLREKLIENGYGEVSIESEHALEVGSLPSIHKDPFDRLLIAQAQVEKMTLLTADDQLKQYPRDLSDQCSAGSRLSRDASRHDAPSRPRDNPTR